MPNQSAIWGLEKRGKSDTFPFLSGWPAGRPGRAIRPPKIAQNRNEPHYNLAFLLPFPRSPNEAENDPKNRRF